jgi:hypothetical protein
LIANRVVWPVALIAVTTYLSLFVNRVPLTPVPFVGSLALTVLLAWMAVGAQAFMAARTEPARVLRHE